MTPIVAPHHLHHPIPRLAVLCSGEGTNLAAILEAIRDRRLRAKVALVISDRPGVKALRRARAALIDAHTVESAHYDTREQFERALMTLCEAHEADLICLAGFMRVLSRRFVHHYHHRILNIHPALLPAFPGARAIRDALTYGVKVTGVTVHVVDEQVDHGPIILQEAVAVLPHDTAATLLARLHRVEHRLYPEAIQLVLDGRLTMRGRTVTIRSR